MVLSRAHTLPRDRGVPTVFPFETRHNMAESRDERSEQLPAGWNQPCLEEHLAEIATSITEWREISPFLGLTEAEERQILGAIPPLTVPAQKIGMLRLWKKKKGRAATYNRLCRAFRKSKQLDLEDEMKEILAESTDSLVEEELVGEGELKSDITDRFNDENFLLRPFISLNTC